MSSEKKESAVQNLREQLWDLYGKGWRKVLVDRLKQKGHDFDAHYVSRVLLQLLRGPYAGIIVDEAIKLRDEERERVEKREKAIFDTK